MTLYAIGDIHGHLDKLRAAHDLVEDDRAREGARDGALIHIGDLVDRGPDSAGVVTLLRDLSAQDERVVVLRGNHDQLMVDFITEPPETLRQSDTVRWIDGNIGGRETLQSYGIRAWRLGAMHSAALEKVPQEHVAFLSRLPRSHRAGSCLFVHAGIRPGIPLDAQDPQDLIWIRQDFLNSCDDHGPLIVHGHTPSRTVEHMGNRLGIDTGAGFGRSLSAVAIEDRAAFLLTDRGRIPIA
ncbi:MAG: metallophosphoesterase family protein [Pseudomonadota bacterium]